MILKVDAIPDREYTGRVVEIGSSGYAKPTQPDVTFFQAKVLFDAPDESLRPGMSARAEIEVSTHADALAVPIQAVVERKPRDGDGKGAGAQGAAGVGGLRGGGRQGEERAGEVGHLRLDRRRDRRGTLRRRAGDHRTVSRAAQARGRRRGAGHHP